MSLLDRLRPDARTSPASLGAADGTALPVGPVMALLTGIGTAAVCWLAITLPALLAWATSAQSTASWGEAVRVSTDIWLVLHRVGLQIPGGSVTLAPLAGTALPLWCCWVAGRRIGAGLTPRDLAAAGSPLRAVVPGVAALSAGYGAVLVLAAALARTDGFRPVLWQALLAGLLIPAVAGTFAALRACAHPALATVADVVHLPTRVRRTARSAGLGVAALVASGALLLAAALITHLDRVVALHHALAPGVVGGAVLALGQLALVPNLALWAVGFIAGPGFAIGAGTLVSPGGSDLGLLPLVPVLGAVPAPGALPLPFVAVVGLPVVVGLAVGYHVARRCLAVHATALDAVADALTAVVAATLGLSVLVALSGGSAGPGALSAVGPSAWRVALALAGELAAGAALAAWATHRRLSR